MIQRWQTGETLRNDTVRRVFNLQIAIIYHRFAVVPLTAPWYCVRNVGIPVEFYYIINVDMY